MALAVPLSRFTPRVGGGSAFFVRPHYALQNMKTAIPVILIIIIVILGCALRYEIVEKKRAVDAAVAANQKDWEMSAVSDSLRSYEALDRGDVAKVKENMMLIANVSAKAYTARYGKATDDKFAADISEAFRILDEYQAAHKQAR